MAAQAREVSGDLLGENSQVKLSVAVNTPF